MSRPSNLRTASYNRRKGGGPITFALVGTGAGGSPTITIPAGFAAGDLCLIMNFGYSADPALPTDVTPSAFTSLVHQLALVGANQYRARISAKILTGAEGTVSGIDGAVIERWVSVALRPDRPISTFVVNSENTNITGSDPADQTIAASLATSLPVVLFGLMGLPSGAIDPRITSPVMDEREGTAANFFAHWKAYSVPTVNHTYGMDDEGTNTLQSGYLTFTPG